MSRIIRLLVQIHWENTQRWQQHLPLAGKPEVVAISPLGFRTSWSYNALDKPVLKIDALANLWTSVFDPIGRPIASIDPLPVNTAKHDAEYTDAVGRAVGQINPLGAIWTSVFDLSSRQIGAQNPLGYVSTTAWDAANNSVATIDPLGNTSTSIYDVNSRQIASQNPLGFLSSTIYNAAGWPAASLDPLSG